ncbi:unnamed protein product [Heterosigma akashiwo]
MIEEEWESLRREARRLESSLEDKIQSYSRLAQRLNTDILYQDVESSPSLDNHEEQSLAVDIEHLLSALSDCNEKMNACVTAGSRTANSALLQRYREILFDYTTEFKNTSVAIQRKRESQELFRSMHGGGGSGGGAARDPAMEHLLRERNAIGGAMRASNSVIGQAFATRDELRAQGATLQGTSGTLAGITSNLPSIGRVVEAIQKKKYRDNMIVGGVIALLICFTLWYLFH